MRYSSYDAPRPFPRVTTDCHYHASACRGRNAPGHRTRSTMSPPSATNHRNGTTGAASSCRYFECSRLYGTNSKLSIHGPHHAWITRTVSSGSKPHSSSNPVHS